MKTSEYMEHGHFWTWSAVCRLRFAVNDANTQRVYVGSVYGWSERCQQRRMAALIRAREVATLIRGWLNAITNSPADRQALVGTLRRQVGILRGK